MPRYLRTAAMAKELECSSPTLLRWVEEGKVPVFKTDDGAFFYEANEVKDAVVRLKLERLSYRLPVYLTAQDGGRLAQRAAELGTTRAKLLRKIVTEALAQTTEAA